MSWIQENITSFGIFMVLIIFLPLFIYSVIMGIGTSEPLPLIASVANDMRLTTHELASGIAILTLFVGIILGFVITKR